MNEPGEFEFESINSKNFLNKKKPDSAFLLKTSKDSVRQKVSIDFIAKNLKKGGSAVVLLSDNDINSYQKMLKEREVDVKGCMDEHRLIFIDWYSHKHQRIIGMEDEGSVIKPSRDILKVSISINKALDRLSEEKPRVALIDFCDSAVDRFDWGNVSDYFENFIDKFRQNEVAAIYPVSDNIEEQQFSTLQRWGDGVFRTKSGKDGGKMKFISSSPEFTDSDYHHIGSSSQEGKEEKKLEEEKKGKDKEFSLSAEAIKELSGKITVEEEEEKQRKGKTNGHIGKKNGERKGKTNGVINGKTNGTINGKTNGAINGKTNGAINGKTNGKEKSTEGEVNGKINGMVNGAINGKTNGEEGLINGITNGLEEYSIKEPKQDSSSSVEKEGRESISAKDGLINGIATAKSSIGGIISSSEGAEAEEKSSLPADDGLINGLSSEGVPIDLSSEEEVKDSIDTTELREGGRGFRTGGGAAAWFRKGVGTVMIMVFLLLIPVFLNILYVPYEEGFDIDGDFEDWQGIRAYQDPPETEFNDTSIDIREYRLTVREGYLYIYMEVEGSIFDSPNSVDSLRCFVQFNETEGYSVENIKADYQLEMYGWDEQLKGTNFYGFNDSRPDDDWNGFEKRGSAQVATGDKALETRVWLGELEYEEEPEIIVHSQSSDHSDVGEGKVIPGKKALAGRQYNIGSKIIERRTEKPVLGLNITPLAGETDIDTIELDYNRFSEQVIDGISIYEKNDGTTDISDLPKINSTAEYHEGFNLTLEQSIDSPEEYIISANVSASAEPGSVVGIRVKDLYSKEGVTSLQRTRIENLYVEDRPSEPQIDGAFSDWENLSTEEDEFDDLAPSGKWNPNIDIRRYGVSGGQKANFLVNVEGNMLGGADVPYKRTRPAEEKDSDRDGIPDENDTYPNDFTNDGTPDEDMVTDDGRPDVDGDGVADWPDGPDKWLNTTIPDTEEFPEEYRNKSVSRYIGPVELPVKTGEDYTRIYIDADEDNTTGYSPSWLRNGAEYMISVRGRNMEVKNATYSEYVGDGGVDRDWNVLGDVTVALNRTSLETSLNLSELGINDSYSVSYVSSDWENNIDTTTPLTNALTDTHIVRGMNDRAFFNDGESVFNDNESSKESLSSIKDDLLQSSSSDPTILDSGAHDVLNSGTSETLYLRDNDQLQTEKGSNELITTLRNTNGEMTNTWTSAPFAGEFNLTSTIKVPVYLDPTPRGNNKPGLNVTLQSAGSTIGSGEVRGLTSAGWQTIEIDPQTSRISPDSSLSLQTRIIGDSNTNSLEVDIDYNSMNRPSRVVLPTDSILKVREANTFNSSGQPDTIFKEGETVEVRANITHDYTAEDIVNSTLSVYYPNGTVMIEDEPMSVLKTDPDSPPYWINYSASFILPDNATGGKYKAEVSSTDNQDHTSQTSTMFTVPKTPGVSIYSDDTKTVEPGSVADFGITVENVGNIKDTYNLVPSSSSQRWQTNLTHGGTDIAIDESGDGNWDWVNTSWDGDGEGNPDVTLGSLAKTDLSIKKVVPEGAEGAADKTQLYAQSGNYSDVSDVVEVNTKTPVPTEMKSLYMHDGNTMNTSVGSSQDQAYIDAGGTHTWTQEPSMAGDFNLVDYATVNLYIEPNVQGHKVPDVTTTLTESGSSIASDTVHDIDTAGWYEFTIPTDVTIDSGNSIGLDVSSGDESITVYYDSSTYNSGVDLYTDTYIDVKWTKLYNQTEETYEFKAGEEVEVVSRVTDPLGSSNIAGANVSIYDPNGTELLNNYSMSMMAEDSSSPSYWVEYNHSFSLPADAPVGTYRVKVRAYDSAETTQSEKTSDDDLMSSSGENELLADSGDETFFDVPADVDTSPDHNDTASNGTTKNYSHTITNSGSGTDYFELSVGSSQGYNITIYGPDGSVMGRDIGGDGSWDYVNPDWDNNNDGNPDTSKLKSGESMDLTVSIEIPEDAETGTQDTTTITATSHRDSSVSDTATDVTTIPEFPKKLIPVVSVLLIFFGMVWYRKKKREEKSGDEDNKDDEEEKDSQQEKIKHQSIIPNKKVPTEVKEG